MARRRFFDYRSSDSTEFLNEQFRTVIPSGVYRGFNISAGSNGGFSLQFTHDSDPDNTGEVIGKIVTRDGVVIEEDANQDNVVVGSVSAGTPNIHYVVANYAYNADLPNNDVVYQVKQGTSGATPTPPTLTDDEVLLGIIDVPSGAASYGASGVDIKTTAKQDLSGSTLSVVRDYLSGIIKPGIYDGIIASEGSSQLDVSLSAGNWVTQESKRISVSAALTDVVTLTSPASGNYRFAWVIGMHKDEDIDPAPSVDYLLVEGTQQAFGTEAAVPTNAEILSTAASTDAKYDDNSYINKLALVRIENRSGTVSIQYMRGESYLLPDTRTVYGGEAQSLSRSGVYFGHEGLKQAIEDIFDVTESNTDTTKQYTIEVDGTIRLADQELHIPSHVAIVGVGANPKILSDTNDVVVVNGFSAEWDSTNQTVSGSPPATGPTTPPAGFVSRLFEITSTYRTGDDLVTRKFSRGDTVQVNSDANATYEGTYVQTVTTSNNWTFEVFLPTQYNTDGNPTDLDVEVIKSNFAVKDIEIGSIGTSASGRLFLDNAKGGRIDNVKTKDLYFGSVGRCYVDILVTGSITWNLLGGKSSVVSTNEYGNNSVKCLRIENSDSPNTINDRNSNFDRIEFNNSSAISTLRLSMTSCNVDSVFLHGSSSSDVELLATNTRVGYALAPKVTFPSTSVGNHVGYFSGTTIGFESGAVNNKVHQTSATTVTDTSSVASNAVFHATPTSSLDHQRLEQPNSDRNLMMVSEASISWNATTNTLTWDDALLFDLPWQNNGYQQIAAGNATLSTDGDRLYIDMDRNATSTVTTTGTVSSKATASTNALWPDRILLAIRYSNTVYLWDSTRIEDGQTVKLGSTPPPDNSVTYEKLTSSALAFHREFYEDYVAPTNDSAASWQNELVLENTGFASFSYNQGTGVVTYTGTIDLVAAGVRVGDEMLLPNKSTNYPRAEIIDVSALASKQITIAPGLSITPGSPGRWEGAIVRGNIAVANTALSTFSYNRSTGRLTYTSPVGYSLNQVKVGYLFVDSAGEKHRIRAVDGSGVGTYVDLDSDIRVDTSTPTTYHHGSIVLDNNPYGIKASGLETAIGTEFIPVDFIGAVDTEDAGIADDVLDLEGAQRYIPTPYDHRVRVHGYPAGSDLMNVVGSGEMIQSRLNAVSFTGVCTGAVIAVGEIGDGENLAVYIDGASFANFTLRENDLGNAYGENVNEYIPVTNRLMLSLPQGVHTIRASITSSNYTTNIRGMWIVNSPYNENNDTGYATDSPGKGVVLGGVLSKNAPTKQISPPALDVEGVNRGGSIVRYIDDDQNYQWASNPLPGESSGASFANGSTDVTLTSGQGTKWRVGDVVLCIGSTEELHVISSFVSADTIRMSTAWTGSTESGNIKYFGNTFLGGRNGRKNEEVAQVLGMADFSCPGAQNATRAALGQDNIAKFIGCRLSDCSTGIKSNSVESEGQYVVMNAANDQVRLIFTGTGCSLQMTVPSTLTLQVSIDGTTIGDFPSTQKDSDAGGKFIVGELSYGTHVLDLDVTAHTSGRVLIGGATIFQPKTPEYTGLALMRTNGVAQKGVNSNGPGNIPYGVIQYEAARVFRVEATTGNAVADKVEIDITQSTAGRPMLASGAVSWAIGDRIIFPFYGKIFTLVTNNINLGTGTIQVRVSDNEGTNTAPSALSNAGFTVSGPDNLTASTTYGNRVSWTFSKTAYHIIEFLPTTADCVLEIDAVEINTPFHSHKRKLPANVDRFLPANAFEDARPLVPFDSNAVGGSYSHISAARKHVGSSATGPGSEPFWFYSPGGFMEISLISRYTINNVTSTGNLRFVVDGIDSDRSYLYLSAGSSPAVGDRGTLICKYAGYFAEGMHFAVTETGHADDALQEVRWSATAVSIMPSGNISRKPRFLA